MSFDDRKSPNKKYEPWKVLRKLQELNRKALSNDPKIICV